MLKNLRPESSLQIAPGLSCVYICLRSRAKTKGLQEDRPSFNTELSMHQREVTFVSNSNGLIVAWRLTQFAHSCLSSQQFLFYRVVWNKSPPAEAYRDQATFKLERPAEHQAGGNCGNECVCREWGVAAPQLQLSIAVQCFCPARPFSFSSKSRNPNSYIACSKQYVGQENITVARYGSQVVSFQPLCRVCFRGC